MHTYFAYYVILCLYPGQQILGCTIICHLLDHRDHINARRRAAYRNKLSDVLGNQQVIGKSASRQSLSDITNVLENRESTKPNVQDVNALAPQSSGKLKYYYP